MKTIDKAVLAGYNAGIERDRLRTGIGLLEFERTKELLLEKLPKAPAVIYDIGGAYGEYSWWLASLGYEVHLFDMYDSVVHLTEAEQKAIPYVLLANQFVCVAWFGEQDKYRELLETNKQMTRWLLEKFEELKDI